MQDKWPMAYTVRRTTHEDWRRTEITTREAFWDLFKPGCDEHLMVRQLRQSEDYLPTLDYVAEMGGEIVGHILYSRSRLVSGDGSEHVLISFGPLSVLPARKGRGSAAR